MIAIGRKVQRKVYGERGHLLVVAIAPEGIYLREYRKRTAFLLPYEHALYRAQVIAADATRVVAARRPKKNGKRGAR